jgi:hypothetical protein
MYPIALEQHHHHHHHHQHHHHQLMQGNFNHYQLAFIINIISSIIETVMY